MAVDQFGGGKNFGLGIARETVEHRRVLLDRLDQGGEFLGDVVADRLELGAGAGGIEGLGHQVLELAHLVTAEGDAGVAVLAFGPDLDLTAERLAEAAQRMDGGGAEEK